MTKDTEQFPEIEQYKRYLQNIDRAPLTIKGYLSDVGLFRAWFEKQNLETFELTGVTPIDIHAYRQDLQKVQGLKARSVNRKLSSIASWMHWAMDTHQISLDPTENMKMVEQMTFAPRWLDRKEQFALQRTIEKDLQISKLRYPKRFITRQRDASLVRFMLNTGLRLSEVTSLEIRDVEISERAGSVLVRHGKGNKERSVPLNAEARKAVEAWLAVRPKVNSSFLWVVVEGTSVHGLSGHTIEGILKRYARAAGLSELTPHMLRHTFAKNLVNSGVSLEKIATLLGHSNLDTTRLYITPDRRDLELAVEQLEA